MAYCKNCGSFMDDNAGFCPSCGASNAPQNNQANQFNNMNNMNMNMNNMGGMNMGGMNMGGQSTWDGGVLDTIVASLVASFLTSITCGIATPWAVCYMMKFILEHTIIDGKRLRFDGNGGQLFGNWIKWMILTVITCGIYSFWVTPKLYQWIAKHTHTA